MMLHQDGSRHAWLAGQPPLDLIVTMDDATGAIYSAFLTEEEGTASTFRALKEVFCQYGLPMSLYTDRGTHYFCTTKAGEIDRSHPTQVGRALEQLGVEHIGAYSPQARGRSERAFGTLQDRLVKELRLAGIAGVEARQRLHPRRLSARLQRALRRRGGGTWVGFHAHSRRRPRRDPEVPGKARCAPISSGRGSRFTSTPTARMPSSTGHCCIGRYDPKGGLKDAKSAA